MGPNGAQFGAFAGPGGLFVAGQDFLCSKAGGKALGLAAKFSQKVAGCGCQNFHSPGVRVRSAACMPCTVRALHAATPLTCAHLICEPNNEITLLGKTLIMARAYFQNRNPVPKKLGKLRILPVFKTLT